MRSARSLYYFSLGLGALGAMSLGTSAFVALRAIRVDMHPAMTAIAACRKALAVPSIGVLLVAGLTLLVAVVLLRALRAAVRHLRAGRALVTRLRPVDELILAGERALILGDPRPRAFCVGFARPRIYVSRGALGTLEGDELTAVVAHERHHKRRRDPLRMLIAEILAEALFFMPAMTRLRDRYSELAELAADEAAIKAVEGDSGPLASAMLSFGRSADPSVVDIAPERVDHLCGERVRWHLPVGSLALALATLAVTAVPAGMVPFRPETVPVSELVATLCSVSMLAFPALVALQVFLVVQRRSRRGARSLRRRLAERPSVAAS